MAATAVAIRRSLLTFRSPVSPSSYLLNIISKRTFSSFSSSSYIPRVSPLTGFHLRPAVSLSSSLQVADVRLNPTTGNGRLNRCVLSSSEFSDPPGCDFKHWLILMDEPEGEGASKHQMIDFYVQTLAKVLGSEEEAKKKIYNVSFENYFGFGCEIDEETSKKLAGLPGVQFALPDTYVDAENKDYGSELYVNGEIVQRSVERQRRVDAYPHSV